MTPDQFAYWLQGYAEINGAPPTAEQWWVIRDHLALVFQKVTPDRAPASIPSAWTAPNTGTPLYPPYTVTCLAEQQTKTASLAANPAWSGAGEARTASTGYISPAGAA